MAAEGLVCCLLDSHMSCPWGQMVRGHCPLDGSSGHAWLGLQILDRITVTPQAQAACSPQLSLVLASTGRPQARVSDVQKRLDKI